MQGLYDVMNNCLSVTARYEKVQVSNDKEIAQSEIPTPQTEGWATTKMTLRYLYQENIS